MPDTQSFVCIACPRGCGLEVTRGSGGGIEVRGQACARGEEYGRAEAVDPRRVLTSTVATAFPGRPRLPVKTTGEIPRARLVEAARLLDAVLVSRPVRAGEVLVRDLAGLGVDLVATDGLAATGDLEPGLGDRAGGAAARRGA